MIEAGISTRGDFQNKISKFVVVVIFIIAEKLSSFIFLKNIRSNLKLTQLYSAILFGLKIINIKK